MFVDGVKTSPAKVEIIGATRLGTKLKITIHEGRNRQVRKMFKAVGAHVRALERTAIGEVLLGRTHEGTYRKLTQKEIDYLKHC